MLTKIHHKLLVNTSIQLFSEMHTGVIVYIVNFYWKQQNFHF